MSFVIKEMLKNKRIGVKVFIKKRIETIDENKRPTYTYKEEEELIETRCLLMPASPYREMWMLMGYRKDIDYLAGFKAGEDIDINDIVILPDNTYTEVKELFPRYIGDQVEYIECVLAKISVEE